MTAMHVANDAPFVGDATADYQFAKTRIFFPFLPDHKFRLIFTLQFFQPNQPQAVRGESLESRDIETDFGEPDTDF